MQIQWIDNLWSSKEGLSANFDKWKLSQIDFGQIFLGSSIDVSAFCMSAWDIRIAENILELRPCISADSVCESNNGRSSEIFLFYELHQTGIILRLGYL